MAFQRWPHWKTLYIWEETQFHYYTGKDWEEMEITDITEIRDPEAEAAADKVLAEVDKLEKTAMALRQFEAAYRVAVRNNYDLPESFTDAYNFARSIT